jgi:D-galactose 1-dehydrogenase
MTFHASTGAPIVVDLDWRPTGPPTWDIIVETEAGTLKLTGGGRSLSLPSGTRTLEEREYPALYEHFAALVRERRSDVDIKPLQLVADIFLRAQRTTVDAFHDTAPQR